MKKTVASLALALAASLGATQVTLAGDKVVNVGVLTDMSGSYADLSGQGSVVAAKLAIRDSGLEQKGWKINLVSADHQNKPDIGSNIARRWIDVDKVDVIADVPASAVVLAVSSLSKEKNTVLLVSGGGASDLTNGQCSPNTIQWTYDTYMTAHGLGKAITRTGKKKWFMLTMDNAGGHSLARDATTGIVSEGGEVVGSVRHPFVTPDFSSFLLQAQGSGAEVLGLANAGADATNSLKQAAEFGIDQSGMKIAATLVSIADVHSLGLEKAQGLNLIAPFYWDHDDNTRAFSKDYEQLKGDATKPTMIHAGVYSSLRHYFKALEQLGENPHDGGKITATMRDIPVDDPLFGKGKVQVNGGVSHAAYLYEVKKPSESKGPWDYYRLVTTIPAEEAVLSLDKSTCPLVKKQP